MTDAAYVLVTPARNEAGTVGATIESVLAQTRLPLRWVIVSDASTDATDEIVKRYATQHAFMRLIRRERGGGHDFGSKVHAINAGLEEVAGLPYDYVGNLDADLTFEPNYFERLLGRFADNPKLGIGGGLTFDFYDGCAHERHASLDSVGGAVQMFRRLCFEEIGGYRPLRGGSEDALALHMARWKGWETRSFPDLPVMHYRKTGTAGGSIWRTRFQQGVTQAVFGWSPAFVLLRGLYRCIERPYVVGSALRTLGYCWASVRPSDVELPPDLIRFIREEQRRKLLAAASGHWDLWRPAARHRSQP